MRSMRLTSFAFTAIFGISARAEAPNNQARITTTGSVEGRPWKPQQAVVFAKKERGITFAEITEVISSSCDRGGTAKAGDRQIIVPIPWKKGATLDLGGPAL